MVKYNNDSILNSYDDYIDGTFFHRLHPSFPRTGNMIEQDIHFQEYVEIEIDSFDRTKSFFWDSIQLLQGLSIEGRYFGTPVFQNTKFFKGINFDYTKFERNLEFRNCEFNVELKSLVGNAFLQKFGVGRIPSFFVKDSLIFDGSHFKFGANFSNFILPRHLSFSGITSGGIIDLSGVELLPHIDGGEDYCSIDLYGAPLDKIKFSYDKFRLAISPIDDIASYEKATNLYEQVLNKFENNGQLTSYEKLDKEYQEFRLLSNPNANIASWSLNLIQKYWNDYGYAKGRIWTWTGGLFIFFWIINWLRFSHIYSNAYTTPSLQKSIDARNQYQTFSIKERKFKKLNTKGIDLAFYYTTIVFFGLKIESKNFDFQNLRGVIYIGTQYVLGLICLAYLANFVITA